MQERVFGSPAAGKGAGSGRLRTGVRRAIIGLIAHLLASLNRLLTHPSGVIHDHRRRQSTDSSPIASVSAGPARRRPGRRLRPGVGPFRKHPPRLRRPVAALHQLVRPGGPARPAGGTPHRGPLPGGPRRLRLHYRHAAPGHLRHRQGPPVGRPRLSRPGPGRARSAAGLGASAGPAPASGRRPHRRRAVRNPAHRSETPRPRPRDGDPRAGRRARPLSTWPWWPSSPTPACGDPRRRR